MRIAAFSIVVVLALAACAGGDDGSPGTESSDDTPVTTRALDETTDGTADTADGAPGGADVETYLVAVSNLVGEAENLTQACQEEVSGEQVVSEESPPDEVELYLQTLANECMVGPAASGTDAIDALVVPAEMATVHADYVAARRSWEEALTDFAAGLETFEDAEAFFVDDGMVTAMDAVAVACRAFESRAAEEGFTATLNCPEPVEPVDSVTVQVAFGDGGRSIDPAGVIDSGGGVELVISNSGAEPVQPVVATLFSGDPAHLPLDGSVVDLGESGVVSDAEETDPVRAFYGLSWPEVTGEDWDGEVPTLGPGDSMNLAVGPGEYVILDHSPGAYAAGDFAVLVVVSLRDIEGTYVARPGAAESCDELMQVTAAAYEAYAHEVRHLTPDAFLASPLSQIDDLRFGALLSRLNDADLGCDGEGVVQSARELFCADAVASEDSASSVVIEQVCEGQG